MFAAGTTTVSWGNDAGNGLASSTGTLLTDGDLLLLGSFNISNALIASNATNVAYLQSHFTTFDSQASGNLGLPGYFSQLSSGAVTGAAGLNISHAAIYFWAFNATSANLATEQLIMTNTIANGWQFPADTDIPNTTTIEIDHTSGGTIVVGSFGVGSTPQPYIDQGAPAGTFMNLAPIPEPATWASLVGGLALVGAFVARRRSAKA